jgi:putative transposase
MPRHARLDITGALHHIMVRGINRAIIFVDDEDRKRFLGRLGEAVVKSKSTVYAWVLMDNHVHILFKSGKDGISSCMRKLLTWYAVYFNRRHCRTGHLFQNRYKSILCDEDAYLLALVRYIHLNPVRAKIVKTIDELDQYPWSGHRTLVGNTELAWMDIDTVLYQFSDSRRKAITEYREFVLEDFTQGRNPLLTGGGLIRSQGGWSEVQSLRRKEQHEEFDERILGSAEFVHAVLKEAEDKELRQLKFRRSGRSIDDIISEECSKRQVSTEELKRGGRRTGATQARAAIANRSKEELGLSGAEIARYLGVSTSSINRILTRLDKEQERNAL